MRALARIRVAARLSTLKTHFHISSLFKPSDYLGPKHIGPSVEDQHAMLKTLKCNSLDELIEKVIPQKIRDPNALDYEGHTVPAAMSESEYLRHLKKIMSSSEFYDNYIGQGNHSSSSNGRILRNHHAQCGTKTRAGEPQLVHLLHALPVGMFARTFGIPLQLSDHDHGNHRSALFKRLVAG